MMRSVFLLVLLGAVALADPPRGAVTLYRDGQAAYDAARYDHAISAWEQSYAASRAPGLLFNLAQAHRLRGAPGDCERASAEYRQYAELAPPSPQTKLAEQYLATGCPRQRSASGPLTGSDDRGHTMRVSGEVVVAGGVVLLATGLYLGHHAASLGDEVTSACTSGCSWADERATDRAGRRDATVGRTLDALGGAALITGAALYYFGARTERISVAVGGRGNRSISLTWSGSW